MAYIGKEPQIGNYQTCDAISVVNGQAAYTMQVSSVNVVPESVNHMIVSLNGVLQKPGSSFTISGSTITFASNLATGDVIDFILLLGNVLDLGTPSDNTVATAKIVANAVTAAKFNADVISGQTALATAPADTDEFLVSDAGVLKRIDYSLIKGGAAHTLLSTSTVSSGVSEVDITSNINSTYKVYMFELINIHPATNGEELHMKFFQGGSLDTGSVYDYANTRMESDNTETRNVDTNTNKMKITINSTNNADSGINGRIFLYNPADTTFDTQISFDMNYQSGGNHIARVYGAARIEETVAVDGVRFVQSSGNIDSGIIKLYGVT